MFENRPQEAKQKALIQLQHHTQKMLDGLRFREWMHAVWESYTLFAQRIKEDSLDDPDLHLV